MNTETIPNKLSNTTEVAPEVLESKVAETVAELIGPFVLKAIKMLDEKREPTSPLDGETPTHIPKD